MRRGLNKNGRVFESWGHVFLHYVGKGWDHGGAMFMADDWEKRGRKTEAEAAEEMVLSPRDAYFDHVRIIQADPYMNPAQKRKAIQDLGDVPA